MPEDLSKLSDEELRLKLDNVRMVLLGIGGYGFCVSVVIEALRRLEKANEKIRLRNKWFREIGATMKIIGDTQRMEMETGESHDPGTIGGD